MRLKVYLTLLLTFIVVCLCGLLIYALLPYKEIIAQGALKGFVGIGIVLFALLLAVLLRVLALYAIASRCGSWNKNKRALPSWHNSKRWRSSARTLS